jgi:general secretion pathway protein D
MLKQIERIVALHDVSEPEVMLEVEILEVSRDKLLALGITWPGGIGLTPLASDATVGLTLQDLRATNAATQLVTLPSGSTWPVINAKATDSDVKTLANPKIRVVNREKAKVMIGDRLPVVTTTTSAASNFAAQSVTYLDVGLKLDVEPVIYRGDEISIKVGLEVSSVTGSVDLTGGGKAYSLGTRNASTVLRLRNGENQVLAGLISDEERNSANKVPGLGDLPLLGLLFGSKEDKNNRKEIILSITPKLVRRVVRPDDQLLEFRSGTEGNSRERPAASEVTTASATPATPAAPAAPTPPAPPAPSASPAASVNPASAASMSAPTAQSAVPTVTPSTPAGENAK